MVTEIPYQVAKSKLIERIAQLMLERRLPLLADIQDESDARVRIAIEPKSRTVEPAVLMEHLFRLTDLEVRIPLNLNVLDAANTPRVMNLREVLQAFLDHRHDVLVRRSRHRLARIETRLEILAGFLICYRNLDRIIRIIREEDEPRPKLMAAFKLTEVQAEAILNMRLRQLRKLEESQIKAEHKALSDEAAALRKLLKDEALRWKTIADEIADIRKRFGGSTPLGRRRTELGEPPPEIDVPLEAVVEREPATVVCSEKGWIRVLKGHVEDESQIKYKEGDRARFVLRAETTDKLLAFATNGRFYTLAVDRLPGGRGHGEPLRLIVEMGNDADAVAMFVHRPDGRLVVASDAGRGFVVAEADTIAQTRQGRQVLNLAPGEEAAACTPVAADADRVAVLGENRKLLVFALDELPQMVRGRGVILQRFGSGGLGDVAAFNRKTGLTWRFGPGRSHTETDLKDWEGRRGQSGRAVPKGFPRAKTRFG